MGLDDPSDVDVTVAILEWWADGTGETTDFEDFCSLLSRQTGANVAVIRQKAQELKMVLDVVSKCAQTTK